METELFNIIKLQTGLLLLVEYTIFFVYAISACYLFVFAFASMFGKGHVYTEAKKKHRFLVLFALNGDDHIILEAIESFVSQSYSREKFDIAVISNSSYEKVNLELSSLPLSLILNDSEQQGKTGAIKKAIDHFKDEQYDIVVIMDPDNLVDNDFLDKINDSYYSGCLAIQAHRVAKSLNSDMAVLDAVSEEINNSIFRKGHVNIGFSSALIGSGMAFDFTWFKQNIFKATHKDLNKQLEILLLEQSVFIGYLENVRVRSEKRRNVADFSRHRNSWLQNRFDGVLHTATRLPMAILKGNYDYCDKLFQWLMPSRTIIFGVVVIIAFMTTFVSWPLSLKWWGLVIMLVVSFSMAIPDYLVDAKFVRALKMMPLIFIIMVLNILRIRKR